MKVCTKCKVNKSSNDFYNDKNKSDRLTCVCKECINKRQKEYDINNSDSIKEYHIDYTLKHKDIIRERSRLSYINNLDHLKEKRDVNKEDKKLYDKSYYIKNIVRLLAQKKDWKKNNQDKSREINKKYKAKRKRNLGFEKVCANPFDQSVKIDWHHPNDNDVVPIPRDIHQLYNYGNNVKLHRDMLEFVVKQIKEIKI